MRMNYATVAPEIVKRVYAMQEYLSTETHLDPKLVKLLQLRASQMNGCAFCSHMHAIELRELGESDVRIDCLPAWRETELYNDVERAALAYAEALTDITDLGVTDEVYAGASRHFSEKDLADLTLSIATINVWNRFGVAFRTDPNLAPAVLKQSAAAHKRAAAIV